MKVFIQNRKTKEFYGDGNRWVATRARALDCQSVANAEKIAREEKFLDVSIVLTFKQSNEPIILPLRSKITLQDATGEKREER